MDITSKQKEVLNAIKDIYIKTGRVPTYEEIRERLGYKTTSSIQVHVSALKRKGYLSKEKGAGLRLSSFFKDVAKKIFNIPLIGEVACGTPNIAVEDIQGYIPYMANKLTGGVQDYFFLRARGNSMDRADIHDSDLLLIKKQNSMPNIGEIAVVLIGNEATVKYFKQTKEGLYYLEPKSSDPIHKPIYLIGQDEIIFCGIVKDIIKSKLK